MHHMFTARKKWIYEQDSTGAVQGPRPGRIILAAPEPKYSCIADSELAGTGPPSLARAQAELGRGPYSVAPESNPSARRGSATARDNATLGAFRASNLPARCAAYSHGQVRPLS